MGAYISLAALFIEVVFLGGVLSVVGFYANRFLQQRAASRVSLQKHKPKKNQKSMSHADAARARAAARARSSVTAI